MDRIRNIAKPVPMVGGNPDRIAAFLWEE